jgi:hypothetical protein
MVTRRRLVRSVAQAGLVVALAGAATGLIASPTFAAGKGNVVNNCYGIWWNTDWNQECEGFGATAAGLYKSTADCTAPQITDESIEKYRIWDSKESYDGPDCNYGIHGVHTMFRE